MKTANLAIVFTDIKGFTERTSRQTLEENERLLDTHARLLKPLFESFGGKIIKSIGDAFMATFESPTQAVLCGAAIQDRLWMYNRTASEEQRFQVRIAVNVGEVRVEHHDVFGEPVNIASRVEGIAEAGEVYFTEAVYLAMNKAEVPSEEVGSFELKGIPGKITVFRIPHAPYRVEAPGTAPRAPEGLPPYGNLGLSRLREDPGALRLPDAAELRKVGGALERLRAGKGPAWLKPAVLLPAALVLLIVAALVIGLSGSEAESAIDDVASATERERPKLVQRAETLIAQEKIPADRAFLLAKLAEAENDLGAAVEQYGSAARLGSSRAERKLVKFLSHDKCPVRSAAASRIASIKLTSAKGDLEDLAEDGGPDDQQSDNVIGAIFGCNSKEAATRALKQLQ